MQAKDLVGKTIQMVCPRCFGNVGQRTAPNEEWVKAYCSYNSLDGFRPFAETGEFCWFCKELLGEF